MRNNKIELLAPAGSMEALHAAVQNGCDAVYLGGRMFGARAFANNFETEELKAGVAYAHVYGVRVFVTVNTLLYEHEIKQVVTYIKELQEADVDALIIQDIGLFSLVKEIFPDMELHASTQMHIHNPQGIKLLKEAGAKRVVVPRETVIEDIKKYSKLGVDLEVFVQGALCVSYSGQCLMSSLTQSRSGNRGECAQSCRMQYTLEKVEHEKVQTISTKGAYLLSPKDLNTIANVPQLIEAGITSFKIEGRMKRPEYVALMCALYRRAIDAYDNHTSFHVNQTVMEEMEKIFNRGFTAGHIFHSMGSSLMNPVRPNHMGVEVGIVESVGKDTMSVRLLRDLYQGDGVRILKSKEDEGFRVNKIYVNKLLVNKGIAGSIIQLDKSGYVEKGSKIVKTSDVKQLERLRQSFEKDHRKIDIEGYFTMKIGEYPILSIQEPYGNTIQVTSDIQCEKALKTPLGKERIQEQLAKCGDTPFQFHGLQLDVDEQGIMPIKELNRMRREALLQCYEGRQKRNGNRFISTYEMTVPPIHDCKKLIVVVHTKEQYRACKEAGVTFIYISNNAVYHELKTQGEQVYKREARVKKDAYEEESVMIQEHGGYSVAHTIVDTSLNITNSYAAAYAFARGSEVVCLSLEHTYETMRELIQGFSKRYHENGNFAVQIYGYAELMLSEYCPINACEKDSDKKNCAMCRGNARYQLKDLKGHRYPILSDEDCRMHLLSEGAIDHIDQLSAYEQIGISSFLCVFTMEDKQQVSAILARIMNLFHV